MIRALGLGNVMSHLNALQLWNVCTETLILSSALSTGEQSLMSSLDYVGLQEWSEQYAIF